MTEKLLPQTLFGVGPAEKYLVDTLNQLQRKKVTAKCMAMISASRSWSNKFGALMRSGVMSVQEVSNLVRLFKAEQALHNAALNQQLDEDLEAWGPELKPEALEAKRLEALALKLAMNIATAALKQVGAYVTRTRMDQLKRERQLKSSGVSRRAWLGSMKLTPEQETRILKLVAMMKDETA